MSDENNVHSVEAEKIDAACGKAADASLKIIDEICEGESFDGAGLVAVSATVASHILARCLFLVVNDEGRRMLISDLEKQISETLESARAHLEQSEAELMAHLANKQ